MGKVFTAEEIGAGHIPEPGAHLKAAQFIVQQLFYDQLAFNPGGNLFFESGISSGMVYGSTVHGTANIRSDLDILIIHHPDWTETLDVVHDVFQQVENQYHVPIEANIISAEDALSNNNTIDPVFLSYLKEAEANPEFSWGWPVTDFLGLQVPKYNQMDLARVVRRYIGAKSSSFGKALASDTELDAHKIQRALELPKNLGRKVLSMFDSSFSAVTASTEDIMTGLDSFITDRKFTFDSESKKQAILRLRYLLQEDEKYSELLKQTINGEKSLDEYQQWIDLNKRLLIKQAVRACDPIASSIDLFVRELESPDWQETKDEIERNATAPTRYWILDY